MHLHCQRVYDSTEWKLCPGESADESIVRCVALQAASVSRAYSGQSVTGEMQTRNREATATVTRNTSRHLILFSSCDMSRHVTHAAAQSVVGSKLFAISQKQRQAERHSKVRRACQLASSPRRAPRAALASLSKPRAVVTARRGEHIGTRRGTRRARRPVLVRWRMRASRRAGRASGRAPDTHHVCSARTNLFVLREGPRHRERSLTVQAGWPWITTGRKQQHCWTMASLA
jgi:hypothetical protein